MIELRCAHHEHHATRQVHVTLDGQPAVPDYPPIPSRLAMDFDLDIWDADRYDDTEGYCTGDDTISRSIAEQGIWEGYETLLALDILTGSSGTFIDVGCQIGWYSVLAVLTGHPVLAIDGDAECVGVAFHNLDRAAGSSGPLYSPKRPEGRVVHAIFDGVAEPMPTIEGGIRLLKADIEGQELAALRSFARGFEEKLIELALVEVTPSWGLDESMDVLDQMLTWGYGAHVVPDKGYPRLDEFVADPLGETLRTCQLAPDDARDYLAGVDQTNLLFAR